MKKAKWLTLPLFLLAITGLLILGCNEDDPSGPNNNNGDKTTPAVNGISIIVMNGLEQVATALPRQLPPGARIVVNAKVDVTGNMTDAFTVSVNVDSALTGKITESDFDPDEYPGAKRIQVAQDAAVNINAREWITITATSVGDPTKTAEMRFVLWGDSVTPANNFDVRAAKLALLPNITISEEDTWEGSIPMSSRFRLVGYPEITFRDDPTQNETKNFGDVLNNKGYILGEALDMLRSSANNSVNPLLRFYFHMNPYSGEVDEDGEYLYEEVLGSNGQPAPNRNGWGVMEFGGMNQDAPNPSGVTWYIDVSVNTALASLRGRTELFINVFNSRITNIELWEQIKPITWSSAGMLFEIEGDVTGLTAQQLTRTITATGEYADQHALIRAAEQGSYLRVTIDTPLQHVNWGTAEIGGTTGSTSVAVMTPPLGDRTILGTPEHWYRFTTNIDLWVIYARANWTPPLNDTGSANGASIRFGVWGLSDTGITGLTGNNAIPIIRSVELFTIDED